jgi:hypothetical protein
VWIRYAGQSAAETPLGRLQQDINRSRQLHGRTSPSRFTNFWRIIELHNQANHTNFRFQCFDIPALIVHGRDQIQVDTREIYLTHMLGRGAALNSQPGGYHFTYRPSTTDRDILQQVISNSTNAVIYLTTIDRQFMTEIADILQYGHGDAMENILTDAVTNYYDAMNDEPAYPEFTANYFNTMIEQAWTPTTKRILGEDNTFAASPINNFGKRLHC